MNTWITNDQVPTQSASFKEINLALRKHQKPRLPEVAEDTHLESQCAHNSLCGRDTREYISRRKFGS